ncbi:hypothetical protein AHF37_08731 [Paragonimus kellicotti]|nr:hypothetical protein AHF37_08731 [Paragonimus kellicotti]
MSIPRLSAMASCRLSVGRECLSSNDCLRLFSKLLNLFLYETGQFSDYVLIQKPKSAYEHLRSSKETAARKAVRFLDSLHEIKQHILDLPLSVEYLLILVGGLPSHPKRAFLVDFSSSLSLGSLPICSHIDSCEGNFLRDFIQHPFCHAALDEMKPSRVHLYFCLSSDFHSDWLLPRPNFRLSEKCPVHILQVLIDSRDSMILDDGDSDLCLTEVKRILYGSALGKMWYASPVTLDGFCDCLLT